MRGRHREVVSLLREFGYDDGWWSGEHSGLLDSAEKADVSW
jgi:hypothetical protein